MDFSNIILLKIMKFIGREEEISVIKGELDRKKFSAILLYGRRRIGKTMLLKHCLSSRDEQILFFTSAKTTLKNNVSAFSDYVSEFFHLSATFTDLPHTLSFISDQSKQKPIILVIDEYSYFRNNNKLCDSWFQAFIDQNVNNKNLTIILSGSLIDVMKNLIETNEPLYGRFTAVIELRPFNYYDSSLFYKERSYEEKIKLYSVFGGVPHYLTLIDPSLTADENIIRLFFSLNSVMESEIEILLNGELSKIETANSVLNFIQNSSKNYKDINQKVSSDDTGNNAAYILDKLVRIGVLEKEHALNKTAKKGLYFIADPVLLFYYTFVAPNRNKFSFMKPEVFFQEFIKEELESNYIPKVFERICREFLIMRNKQNRISPVFFDIGRLTYHDRKTSLDYEFDIVTTDRNGNIYYECKYTGHPVDKQTVNSTIAHAEQSSFHFYTYGFFSRSGYEKSLQKSGFRLYTLKDLFAK